jgi:hypothetical protein
MMCRLMKLLRALCLASSQLLAFYRLIQGVRGTRSGVTQASTLTDAERCPYSTMMFNEGIFYYIYIILDNHIIAIKKYLYLIIIMQEFHQFPLFYLSLIAAG